MYTSSGNMLSFNSVRFWMPIILMSTLLACRLTAKPGMWDVILMFHLLRMEVYYYVSFIMLSTQM